MESKKIATVTLNQKKDGNIIFSAGLFKKEIDRLVGNGKYVNTYLVSDKSSPEKLFLIERPEQGVELNKELVVYGSVSLYSDKLQELEASGEYINIAIAPKTAKEGEVLTEEQKNELVIFQTTGTEEKKTIYCGKGVGYHAKSVGIGFLNEAGNLGFINCSLDKVKLAMLSANEYGNILLGIKEGGVASNEAKYAVLYPTQKGDKEALGLVELNKVKVMALPYDDKGFVRVTISDKKEESIQKDKANMNVYQTKTEADKDKETNYVGKGWDWQRGKEANLDQPISNAISM